MLGLEEILAAEPFAHCDRAVIEQIMNSAQRLAEDLYLPSAARLDACPPSFVNGEVEMAAAFDRAGFTAIDVHMTDLLAGRISLRDFRGVSMKRWVSISGSPGFVISMRSPKISTVGPAPVTEKS